MTSPNQPDIAESGEPWRETVRKIYDELHFGQDSVFDGDGRELARRIVNFIEKRHADYFCEPVETTENPSNV